MKASFFRKPCEGEEHLKKWTLCWWIAWLEIPFSAATYYFCGGTEYDHSPLGIFGVLVRIVVFIALQSLLFLGVHMDSSASPAQKKKIYCAIFISSWIFFGMLALTLSLRFQGFWADLIETDSIPITRGIKP